MLLCSTIISHVYLCQKQQLQFCILVILPTGERLGQANDEPNRTAAATDGITETEHEGDTADTEETSTEKEKERIVQLVPHGQLPCTAQILHAPNGMLSVEY